jgi:hypothetical protein
MKIMVSDLDFDRTLQEKLALKYGKKLDRGIDKLVNRTAIQMEKEYVSKAQKYYLKKYGICNEYKNQNNFRRYFVRETLKSIKGSIDKLLYKRNGDRLHRIVRDSFYNVLDLLEKKYKKIQVK